MINERIWNGYVTTWTDFRFLDGIIPVMRRLSRLRLPMIVVSNQSGVSRGLMGPRTLRQITVRFVDLLARHGARIDGVYYCPHTDDNQCSCRKPKPGLLLAAARDYGIELSRSVMVGDDMRDVEAARTAGCHGIVLEQDCNTTPAFGHPSSIEQGSFATGQVRVQRLADLPARVAEMLDRVLV